MSGPSRPVRPSWFVPLRGDEAILGNARNAVKRAASRAAPGFAFAMDVTVTQ
jgi:hypothetical protein